MVDVEAVVAGIKEHKFRIATPSGADPFGKETSAGGGEKDAL